MKKSPLLLQFFGFVFTSVVGTLLHFVFDWSKENVIVALFSAVNESIWEHMKLLYFPMVIFALYESRYFKNQFNFWCAKAVGITIGVIIIPVIYYSYTGALGVSCDWFNITIFFIAASLVYYLENVILKNNRRCFVSPIVSKIFIFTLGVLFVFFTFLPPRIPLFCDPLNSAYGYFKFI